jgi:S1-C subfamily serine protease
MLKILRVAVVATSLFIPYKQAVGCDNPYNPKWDRCVIEILKPRQLPDSGYANFGTGFLVRAYDTLNLQLLVSNRHILENRSDLFIRVNVAGGRNRSVDTVSLEVLCGLGKNVLLPEDPTLDLAALPMPMIDTSWDVSVQVKSMFAPLSKLARGTEVYFLGFPGGISMSERSVPVYRSGVIALDRTYGDGGYLLDATVIGGSSGSPVFNCQGNFVGVILSHINSYSADPNLPEVISREGTIDGALLLSSELAGMIQVDRIIEFLTSISSGWGK